MSRPTSKPSQLIDPFTGLSHGTDRLFLKGLVDQFAISGHLTDRAVGVPPPQALQAAFSKGGNVPLDRGPTDSRDLGCILASETVMQQPQREHLLPDACVRVSQPLLIDDLLLLLGQLNAKPSQDAPPYDRTPPCRTSLPEGSYVYHNPANSGTPHSLPRGV